MTKPIALPLLALALLLPGMSAQAERVNRGSEPVKQPVVQRTDHVFDAEADPYSPLGPQERQRLVQWFDAIRLGYGDRVSIAGISSARDSALAASVASIIGRYGLLLAPEAPATAGEAQGGAVRIVVSRASASVPGCPDFRAHAETDFIGGLSYNYGCATNSNLAAMVADPMDLVEGRGGRSDLVGATSGRAIKAYRDATPSGGGGMLK